MSKTDIPSLVASCFVCNNHPADLASERPFHWIAPRALCGRHKAMCTLPGGEHVRDFLARGTDRASRLEGSGLGYFLNPVTVEGHKGWCDFAGGGMAVFEEFFPAQSRFEYAALHSEISLDFLFILYTHRSELALDRFQTLIKILELNAAHSEALTRLTSWYDSEQEVGRFLLSKGKTFITSTDEILEYYDAFHRNKMNPSADSNRIFFDKVLGLASIRFAHLNV